MLITGTQAHSFWCDLQVQFKYEIPESYSENWRRT